jgi:hypothetical protein
VRTFRIDPYGLTLRLLTGEKETANWAARCGVDALPAAGVCWMHRGVLYVAVLDRSLATLVHELGHAAIRVMEHIGHPVCSASDEPFCYLLDHLYALCAPVVSPASSPSPSPAGGCTDAS